MSAINEGKCAYKLGSSPDANPYRKAKKDGMDDGMTAKLKDWECQWDSGYAIQKRNESEVTR
jgi:hypothetical protein